MARSRVQDSKNQGDNSGQWTPEIFSKKLNGTRHDERKFDLVIDGVPYFIRSSPFLYNDELRFHVIVNNDTEHVFTWDSQVSMLRAIDDDASTLSDRLEEAISEKLQSQGK
jgi:hypothetical protein